MYAETVRSAPRCAATAREADKIQLPRKNTKDRMLATAQGSEQCCLTISSSSSNPSVTTTLGRRAISHPLEISCPSFSRYAAARCSNLVRLQTSSAQLPSPPAFKARLTWHGQPRARLEFSRHYLCYCDPSLPTYRADLGSLAQRRHALPRWPTQVLAVNILILSAPKSAFSLPSSSPLFSPGCCRA